MEKIMMDNEIKVAVDILNDKLRIWNLPIKEKIATETAIKVMQLYLSSAGKMPTELVVEGDMGCHGVMRIADVNKLVNNFANKMRQECILAQIKKEQELKDGLPSVGEIQVIIAGERLRQLAIGLEPLDEDFACAIHARLEKGSTNV